MMDGEANECDSADRGLDLELTWRIDNSAHRMYREGTCQLMFARGFFLKYGNPGMMSYRLMTEHTIVGGAMQAAFGQSTSRSIL